MYLIGLIKLKIKEIENLKIENFYPSITMELLYKSIQFAKEITSIPDEDLDNYAIKKNYSFS